ncbi:CLUMA_CG006384, isoform A [Clunio marinus]|uniref:CLUMA_CG006384, isoform A n=1 Tax=Clunio marinus TaxID=568069 RepID=A0A1J1HZ85_9DIPT|nr:CLUMA_CG006384, isoform A [Clunio marinus]
MKDKEEKMPLFGLNKKSSEKFKELHQTERLIGFISKQCHYSGNFQKNLLKIFMYHQWKIFPDLRSRKALRAMKS